MLDLLRNAAARAGRTAPGWLDSSRQAALAALADDGWPTVGHEDWRYTDPANVLDALLPPTDETFAATINVGRNAAIADLDGIGLAGTLVVVAGRFDAARSRLPGDPAGLRVTPFAQAGSAAIGTIERTIREAEGSGAGAPLSLLGAALSEDGLLIEVTAGHQLVRPLLIRCDSSAGTRAQNRLVVRLGAGAAATLLLLQTGDGPSNTSLDVAGEAGSTLDLVRLQLAGSTAAVVGCQRLALQAEATARVVQLDLGGGLVRHDLLAQLAGRGTRIDVHGLFVADGRRHLDHCSRIDHRSPGSTSRSLVRGIADDHGRGIFHGSIVVHPGAAGADARLTNQNLLLSATAEIDTKPELEILVDDVRCAHGATTGQLDPQALFYLRSRGLPESEARALLIGAFARDILARIADERLRQAVMQAAAATRPEWRQLWSLS
jgi:Fe-S cluster assembly protein SufD